MRVLTIDVKKWRYGGDSMHKNKGETALLNRQGYMCCLGFDALACGIPAEVIEQQGEPETLIDEVDPYDYPGYFTSDRFNLEETEAGDIWGTQNEAVKEAIKWNDLSDIPFEERKAKVRAALLKLGWDDVIFEGSETA